MAGPTFQVPVHLDPNQDSPQQLSFINQNFQNLAAALESQSFRIVASGLFSIQADPNSTRTYTVPHNLGYKPIPMCFLSASDNSIYYPLPTWTSLTRDDANHQVVFETWIEGSVDSVNLYVDFYNAVAGAQGPYNLQYYLLQQAAN